MVAEKARGLEKGEVAIIAGQFAALAVAILLLSGAGAVPAISTPQINSIYWGGPPPASNISITKSALNRETVNASTISVFYGLAAGTTPDSAAASRLCLSANGTGKVFTYVEVSFLYDNASKKYYMSFGPGGGPLGEQCTYTVTLTDSLLQSVTATWIVEMEPPASS